MQTSDFLAAQTERPALEPAFLISEARGSLEHYRQVKTRCDEVQWTLIEIHVVKPLIRNQILGNPEERETDTATQVQIAVCPKR